MRFIKNIFEIITDKTILQHIVLSLAIAILIITVTFLGLRIYTMHGRTIETPNLYGTSIDDAKKILDEQTLRIEIADSVYQEGIKPGTIVSQNPPSGFHVKKHRKIHVTIKAYLPEKTTMPNVTGVSLRQAKAVLESSGLYVGKIVYKPDMALNNVLEQQYKGQVISPGTSIVKGSDITLVLGNGYQTNYTKTPDLHNLHLSEAKIKIPSSYINLGKISYDNSIQTYKDSIDAVIYRQRPNPEQNVQMGTEISIWLTNENKNK